MDKELKQKWIDALRSGNYNQGREFLHPTKNTFCALGVLADIKTGNWDEEREPLVYKDPFLELINSIGWNHKDKIVQMNDYEEKSFDEIADYIEANL